MRVPLYVDWMREGWVRAGQQAEVVTDGGAFVVLDGNKGFGQTIAAQAVALGVERAGRTAAASWRCATPATSAGSARYAETAIAAGLISIHFVNVAKSPLVAPFGAVERRFSTAPFAIGIPLPERPVVLDFATSLVAEGKVQVASYGGRPLPPDALIGPEGGRRATRACSTATTAPPTCAARERGPGAIRAFGEHKGSGLALMCELLAGAFTGGGCAGPIDGPRRASLTECCRSTSPPTTSAPRPSSSGSAASTWTGCSPRGPIDPAAPVLAPGDPEAATRAARLAEGVPLPVNTWAAIRRTAEGFGVPA